MDIQTIAEFFKWCIVINGGFLVLWAALSAFAPGFFYRSQCRWFDIPRETFDVVNYSFLGFFKILIVVFNAVPYLALLVLDR
jgi:hypothetical protein